MKVSIEGTIHTAKAYPFPKKGNAEATYTLAGVDKVAMTGGGKHPKYVYMMIDGASYYLPKNVVPKSGAAVEVLVEKAEVKTLPVKAKVKAKAPRKAKAA